MPLDPEILRLNRKNPRWKIALPGLFGGALMFGIAALVALLDFLNEDLDFVEGESDAALPVFLAVFSLFSAGFLAGLVLLIWGRWETVIDRRRRTVTRRWGLGPWRSEKVWPLQATHVELRKELRRYKVHAVRRYFPVFLCGEGEAIPLSNHFHEESLSRRDAEPVSAFLGLELHDRTGDADGRPPRIYPPEGLDVPLAPRVQAGTEPLALPKPPFEMRSEIEREGEEGLVITLPPRGFLRPLLIFAALGAVFFLLFGSCFVVVALIQVNERALLPLAPCFLLPLLVLGGVFAWLIVGSARFRAQVHVSPALVRVVNRWREAVVTADELEDVWVEGQAGQIFFRHCQVKLRSPRTEARFGSTMTRVECEYLAELIRGVVVQR